MEPTERRRPFRWIVGGVVLVAVAGAVWTFLGTRASDPERLVDEYLSAIAAGDFAHAGELVAVPDERALRDAGDRPPVVSVDDADEVVFATVPEAASDDARFRVTRIDHLEPAAERESHLFHVYYAIGDATAHKVLEVVPDGRRWLFFPGWRIADPLLAAVYVPGGNIETFSYTVGELELQHHGAPQVVVVYPGQYVFTRPSGAAVEEHTVTFVMTRNKDYFGAFADAPTESLLGGLTRAARAELEDCIGKSAHWRLECSATLVPVSAAQRPASDRVDWSIAAPVRGVAIAPGSSSRATATADIRAEYVGASTGAPVAEVVSVRTEFAFTLASVDDLDPDVSFDSGWHG